MLLGIHNTEPRHLDELLASVAAQGYRAWEICAVDDSTHASNDRAAVVARWQRLLRRRFRYEGMTVHRGIAGTLNRCLELATGDVVIAIDHDDLVLDHAIASVVLGLCKNSAAPAVYTDEVVIEADGQVRGEPVIKPDWSPELVLAVNYVNHLCAYRSVAVRDVDGYRPGTDGAEDHDLLLRVTERHGAPIRVPLIGYAWRAVPESTASSLDAKPYASAAGLRVVSDACARRRRTVVVSRSPLTHQIDVRDVYGANERHGAPVAVIVDVRSTPCSERAARLEALRRSAGAPHFLEVLHSDAKMFAAAVADLEWVALFTDLPAESSPNWLQALEAALYDEHIGAVGGLLLDHDGSVWSAGLERLATGHFRRRHAGTHPTSPMPLHWVNSAHEVQALPTVGVLIRGGLAASLLARIEPDSDVQSNLASLVRERNLTNYYIPRVAFRLAGQ